MLVLQLFYFLLFFINKFTSPCYRIIISSRHNYLWIEICILKVSTTNPFKKSSQNTKFIIELFPFKPFKQKIFYYCIMVRHNPFNDTRQLRPIIWWLAISGADCDYKYILLTNLIDLILSKQPSYILPKLELWEICNYCSINHCFLTFWLHPTWRYKLFIS